MKRAAENEDPQNMREKPFRRQNPVSCQFCRSKKLKCDRAHPCSNCVARGINCSSALGDRRDRLPTQVGDLRNHSNSANSKPIGSDEIGSRLKKLEQAVFSMTKGSKDTDQSRDEELTNTATWLEATIRTVMPYDTPAGNDSVEVAEEILSHSTGRSNPEFYLTPNCSVLPTTSAVTVKEVGMILPDFQTAQKLLNHYLENVNWISHIIHVPTTRKYLDKIYQKIKMSQELNKPKLALITTILAIGTVFWPSPSELSLSKEGLKDLSAKLANLTQRVLSEAGHSVSPTIETMQASMLCALYLPKFQDSGDRGTMLGSLIRAAHKLQLHRLDSDRNKSLRAKIGADKIDLEIKRRVWWTLVSTDWILSFTSGPESGTYMLQPDQFTVDRPSNCDDEEITHSNVVDHPYFEAPTDMSFSQARVSFSHLLRDLVDTANKKGLEVDELDYDTVLIFDEKFQYGLEGMAYFTRLDADSVKRTEPFVAKRPYLPWQRIMSHFALHARLMRLHRPYLLKGYKDHRFAYSRTVCLRSARMVIEAEESFRNLSGGWKPDSGRQWVMIHHLFVATVTLVMDYCSLRDDPQASEKRQEILKCYKLLEVYGDESSMARNGLTRLKQITIDWRMRNEAAAEPTDQINEDVSAINGEIPPTEEVGVVPEVPETVQPTAVEKDTVVLGDNSVVLDEKFNVNVNVEDMMDGDLILDDWLDPFNFDLGIDMHWESLFNDLENQMTMG